MEWAKLKDIVFKTGEFKDTGSPTRALTDNEKKYFQGLIDDMYVQFLEAVSSGRKMDIPGSPFHGGRTRFHRQGCEGDGS